MSNFEYDDDKSQVNLEKHGIDFLDARALWKDPYLLEIQVKSDDEPRFHRNGTIRLISVRRSRKREVELYES